MDVNWTSVDLPWDTRTYLHEPPYPRPDTTDLERQELDGLTALEAYNASFDTYKAYCKAHSLTDDFLGKNGCYPLHDGQRAMLLAHQARVQRIRAVEGRIFETPPLLAWRQAFEEAKEATIRLSFKNWLQVGMVFETEDGRQFLVGNMDVSGDEGGCCPTNSITNETRIVRYCTLDLPFNLTHE